MKKEELIELSNRIQEKIGKEASALIQDDLGILITDNETTNTLIQQKEAEISKEKSLNENYFLINMYYSIFESFSFVNRFVKNLSIFFEKFYFFTKRCYNAVSV